MPFPSPFDAGEPHPLAREAALRLQRELGQRGELFAPGGGKMFGVLVARDAAGRETVLRAFSGQLDGAWHVDGFVGPLFDAAAREAIEPAGVRTLARLTARHEALSRAPELSDASAKLEALKREHRAALEALTARHREARAERDQRRKGGAAEEPLAQESRKHKTERRWLEAAQAEALVPLERALAKLERRVRASERLRALVSRRLMAAIFDCYRVPNFRGETVLLRTLYAGAPPSGAGDCAAAKLLGAAATQGLTPLAMAEFFWGAPSSDSPRRSGEFSAACRLKCGPLLPFMLRGLEVAPPRGLGAGATVAPLTVLYEDAWLVAVDKPEGLLSVPGRMPELEDSVQSRLVARYPGARLVHRLDLDTSGVLVAAKSAEAHRALQHQFAARTVEKRYLALVEGDVAQAEGKIDLALRVDLADRPRQLHDPVHGRAALTAFKVLERRDGRTRLELTPRTGRTHQLRVHAALGLKAPIVGDRLYGTRGPRLMLHAWTIAFRHPETGAPVRIESPPPF